MLAKNRRWNNLRCLGVLKRVADTSAASGLNRFGRTQRRDAWFFEILPTLVVFIAFLVYATWRAFEGKFYWAAPYLSPFYSPLIDPNHHWWPLSPALLILGGPAGFRFTCYYYRKAYYRAFVFHPPACAVGEERHGNYRGEAKLPLILQNVQDNAWSHYNKAMKKRSPFGKCSLQQACVIFSKFIPSSMC